MSNLNDSMKEEEKDVVIVSNDLSDSSLLSNSSTISSNEELPIPRLQDSSSSLMTSLITTTSQLSISSEIINQLHNVTLPYPLQLDKEYIYRIGLNPNEFIDYCQFELMNFMFNDPMDIIENFIR
ncbi:unnamed protein product [Rotaria sordida]|uniref:Uncharacterized protein n=1 Tax=Rotaria sordida TaxID=392033 RepID=A0A814QPK9_9BILA|nr:unnamed protein product [Rotaria sordida]CAF1425363.1 unnamed protein product [Rotaria sordida]